MRARIFLLCLPLLIACKDDSSTDDSGPVTDDSAVGEIDADDDGYPADLDCDDDDAAINPGADEVCDQVDNDCDGLVDDDDESLSSSSATIFFTDADGDGFGIPDGETVLACAAPSGYAATTDDCDDAEPTTYPEAPEVCDDGVDDGCSGLIDCDDGACGGDSACVPVLDGVSPASGYYGGETDLTLTGGGFATLTAGTTTVSLGDESCADVTVVDDATLTCTAPSVDEPATVDVTVTNDNGSATLADGFSWIDCLYVATGREGIAGSLYCVDVDGGETVIEIGELGYGLTGMAFSPDGVLYAVQSTEYGNLGDSKLLTINHNTAEVTEVGVLYDTTETSEVHQSMPDLTFVGSRLVGWSETYVGSHNDNPVEIDTATGEVTEISNDDSFGTADTALAYDGEGSVYLLEGGLYGDIIELDVSTGTGTTVASSDNNYTYGSSAGGTFYLGQLYSLDCESTSEGACTLVTVDVETGALSPVDIELPNGLDAIASPAP